MKKVYSFFILTFAFLYSFAQAPQGFNYQAVARDASGVALINQAVGLQLSLRQNAITGTIVYTETHTIISNNLGLINLVVGNGTATVGTFNTINWANGPYFIEISMDVTGGASYSIMGTQQLMSVPYALYAESAGTSGTVGPTGATGANGINGTNGLDGATGAQGAIGVTGANGINGTNGLDGINGIDGTTGVTGSTGLDGATGANGINGNNGLDGINGIDGATGVTGATGFDGATGANGINGTNGLDGINGIDGATGVAGATGLDGATGANGINGTNGLDGINGIDGATGVAGATGLDGATGANGINGTNGLDGINGIDGATGVAGATGLDGATGANGINGTNGLDGINGIDGATGVAGATGLDGATGANGINGTNGLDGINGIDGATGATGAAGINGATGTNGATGMTGATGPLINATTGQTLRHDGADWVANSTLYNDGNKIGVGTPTPDASAKLEVSSTTSGFLLPRLTTVQRNNIASAATGLLVFNTTTNSFDYYTGTTWLSLGASMVAGSTVGDMLVWNGAQWVSTTFKYYYADRDGDTYGDHFSQTFGVSPPYGFVSNDCDLDDTGINPGNATLGTFWPDADGDGYGNPSGATIQSCYQPTGYAANSGDCNDANAQAYPGAMEIADGIDNNCNAVVDEQFTFYLDNDLDGYGALTNSILSCYPIPSGYVTNSTDCNDAEYYANPGIPGEACDGIDNNCDGQIDEGPTYVFADNDGDGFGGFNTPPMPWICSDPLPLGYVNNVADCDDNNPNNHPGATEICDGQDNDCNGLVDDNVTTLTTFYADADQDAWGDATNTIMIVGCTPPTGYLSTNGDCNDSDPGINPGAQESCNGIDDNCNGQIDEGEVFNGTGTTYYFDGDGDSFGDFYNTLQLCSPLAGYTLIQGDCDDNNAAVYPGAAEVCDNIDNNCDGNTDEGLPTTFWYTDNDGDGYGDPGNFYEGCFQQFGYVASGTDCDDWDPSIYPGAPEVCDGLDNDCNGQIDDNPVSGSTWYQDADSDGYGNPSVSILSCNPSPGYSTSNNGDCDDANANVNPGATEICDGLDNDCNGQIDDNAIDGSTWYRDADSDGYGNPSVSIFSCNPSPGYSTNNNGDCDDANANVNPGATEICDGLDNDCNGQIDDNAIDGTTWYRDADSDGYGNLALTVTACIAPPGYVADNTDCHDANANVNPGASEICDGFDNDCNGQIDDNAIDGSTWYRDADSDGYGNLALTVTACIAPPGYVADNSDCHDVNFNVHPGATEICDGLDNDCNGQIDDNAIDGSTWYRDADSDGYGNPALSVTACVAPIGYVAGNSDCHDANANVYPGATEFCDGLDNDCNGQIDDNPVDGTTWYRDADSDGYGTPALSVTACIAPPGYVADNTDCHDANPTINPGATEICGNGIDDNCNGQTDELGCL